MAFHLIRHLEPSGSVGVCYGRRDLTCDSAAVQHAATSLRAQLPASALRDHPIFTSPLSRCLVLARALAAPAAPSVTEALIELDFGSWEGKRWDALPRDELDAWAGDVWRYRPGGGESAAMVEARWVGWCERVAPRGDETVIAVTHAGVIRAALAASGSFAPEEAAHMKIEFGSMHRVAPPARAAARPIVCA